MSVLQQWHSVMTSGDPKGLDELLADDAVFHSPVVHRPQQGKMLTKLYLSAAFSTLYNDSFEYLREIEGTDNAALEFRVEIDGIVINGVDWFHWNEDGKIDDFKVWLRPLKAVNLVHQKMGEMLAAWQGSAATKK